MLHVLALLNEAVIDFSGHRHTTNARTIMWLFFLVHERLQAPLRTSMIGSDVRAFKPPGT